MVLETTVLPTELFSLKFKKMKLKHYISEIKNRLILLGFSLTVSIFASYYYKETLLFLTVKNLNYSNQNNSLYFISTNITEIITTYFKICYISSFALMLSLAVYHLLLFLSPALTFYEYLLAKKYFLKSAICFFLSIFIFNKYLMPIGWDFFLNFQNMYSVKTINVYFECKMEEYVNFYSTTCVLLFLISQFCIGLFMFLDCLDNKVIFVRNSRKIFYLIFLMISTMITPPDVLSQLSTLLFFSLIYENLILITMFKYYLIRKPIKT